MDHGNHPAQLASFIFALLVVLELAFTDVGAARHFTKQKLKYYVQLQAGAPDIAPNFLPPLNTTFSASFGAGVLFAFNVTKEVSRTSQLLGAPSLSLDVVTIQYDDGCFAGTLQVQGLVEASDTEVAITGGTGSFRGARGYLLISVAATNPPNFISFLHELYFL